MRTERDGSFNKRPEKMRPVISIWRGWRGSAVVIVALISTAVPILIANSMMKTDLEREANNAKGFAKALLQLEIEQGRATRLDILLELPQVKGAELFSPSGRRIAGVGEPLEIVGYRLDRDIVLRYAPRDGSRHEIYWPPRVVESEFGLAVRLDIGWLRKRRTRLIIEVAAVQLVALTAVAALFLGYSKPS